MGLDEARDLEQSLGREGVEVEDESGRRRILSKNLLSVDELQALPPNEGILTTAGRRPVRLRCVPYYRSRRLRKQTEIPPPPMPANAGDAVQYLELG